VLAIITSILLALLQTPATTAPAVGVIVGIVKLPNGARPSQPARVTLLPPKYTEIWNKQVQQRLDNYWEIFKPEFTVNKERIYDFNRMSQIEALRYVTSQMRRDLGDGASNLMKDASANGQFEFRGVPFGTYQLLVQALDSGDDILWSRTLDVQSDVPIFVDLGKPVS
jgi:hypothetical protein